MKFHLLACRFQLSARAAVQFPPRLAGNVLRGALGSMLRDVASPEDYARIFEPAKRAPGPSGLSDLPRPFVIRAGALGGRCIQPGERFCFSVNLFDTREETLHHFTRAFGTWADVVSVEHPHVELDLNPRSEAVSRLRVEFQTPTELKSGGAVANAEFVALLARARDRVSTLRSLYGEGPLDLDFRGLSERARSVQLVHSEFERVAVERRSSRNGQRHDIGGLVGFAEYEGDLAEFLPYLEAAHWTGVGRHCTWGNGQIATTILAS